MASVKIDMDDTAVRDSVQRLVDIFIEASRSHHQATMEGDYKRTNREADRIHETFLKLRELGTEAREALIQVALTYREPEAGMAAAYSLKYDSDRALTVLKRLSKDSGILGFEAAETIKRWKSGEWQLE